MRPSLINKALIAAAGGFVLSVCAPALAAGAGVRHLAAPNHRVVHSTSTNWSGYAVQGAGPYTSVSSNWTQPAVNCTKTPSGYSAFWIGLDGDTTNTVEQTGTEAECSSGKPVYFAWYEMYPKYPVNFTNRVLPGDSFSSSVTYVGSGYFRLVLSDSTEHWSQTITQRLKSAKLGSAEAIAEAPYSGGVLPLADFGTVGFANTTVNGSVLTSSTPGIEPITMVTSAGAVKAAPSAISAGGFTDTWYSQ
jgi:Peptidase A4 family